MKCIIVDDEPVARKILREFVEQVPSLELAGEFENMARAETFIQTNKTDLVFLDIEMPKRTGIDYLKTPGFHPLVILTTAYPEYALEGYELDIIDYLLKPIAFSRFSKAVQKAKEYAELKGGLNSSITHSYLFVRSERRIEKIELAEILYIESMGNYVNIYTENKRIIAYLTMKSLEAQLPAQEFIKIHQSFMVNFAKISAIEGNQLQLKNKSLPISRHYRDAVMKVVEQRMLKR